MSNRKIDNLREPSNLQLKIQTGYPTAIDAKEGVVTLRYIPGTGLALFAYHANRWNMTKLSNMNAKDESIVENLKVKNLQIDKTAKFNGSSVDISEKNIPSIRKWDKSYNDIRSGEIEANFKKTKVKEDLQIGPDNNKILLKNTDGILETKNSDDSDYSKITAKTLTISGLPSTAGEIGYDSGLFKMKNGSAVNNIMSHSSDGVVLKTRAGADIIFQADNFTIQDPTTDSKMLKFDISSLSGTNTLNFPLIKVQSDNPSLVTEFDSQPFIFATGNNRLYCKIDNDAIAYEAFTRVPMAFSIDDVTFRTSSGGTTETANAILVGTPTNMFVRVNYNNDDGTLDANPTISYKKNGSETDSIQDASHLGTSVASNTHTSGTAFVVPQTDNASDSSADGALSRHCVSGDYISAKVISIDDTVNSDSTSGTDDTSEKYYFVNGMVWGSCAATTGPTQDEFNESFLGGIDNANKGYKLPTLSGGAFSNSQYHSDLGTITIAADSGSEYIYFGYPDQGGSAATIKDSGGNTLVIDASSGDFRPIQTADRQNSAGYTETYNFYVSVNTGVTITDMVVT